MKKINFEIHKKIFSSNKQPKGNQTSQHTPFERNVDILQIAYNAYSSLDNFRKEAHRHTMYTFGNQWGDFVRDPQTGKYITEENYIKKQGKIPLKTNLIRGLVRTILGQFSQNQTESVCIARDRNEQELGEMMTASIQANYQLNKLWDLDRRALEAFLITGLGIYKTYYGWKDGLDIVDVWTDTVNHNRFFFDPFMEDPRHWDCSLVGEIHDLSYDDLIAHFSEGNKKKALLLQNIYKTTVRDNIERMDSLAGNRLNNMNFFFPNDASRCRVIEVWRKESKERLKVHDTLTGEWYKVEIGEEERLIIENQKRLTEQTEAGVAPEDMKLIDYYWYIDRFWYYRFLSPYGDILSEGETPYWHKSHPYSFKIYPFFNSEVHSFVGDAVDQNRYINRLIVMQDFVMGSAAKGVLMFPETSKPDNMSMEEIAEEWVSYNGIIYYKPIPGVNPPQQIIANTTKTGAYEMLSLQMQLYKDTTGVYGALQGQQPPSGTPAAMYNQQTQNSATNLIDVLESFRQLREDRDILIMKLQQQYYTDIRYLNIIGSSSKTIKFNPEKVRNVSFDLAIVESISTPAYRMIQNELLLKLLEMGQINVEMLLENGSFPFADKLLQDIKNFKTQLQEQQIQEQQTQKENLGPEAKLQYEKLRHIYNS